MKKSKPVKAWCLHSKGKLNHISYGIWSTKRQMWTEARNRISSHQGKPIGEFAEIMKKNGWRVVRVTVTED